MMDYKMMLCALSFCSPSFCFFCPIRPRAFALLLSGRWPMILVLLTSVFAMSAASAESPAGPTQLIWLTSDGHIKRDPVFWPGKKLLAYTVEDDRTGAMKLVRLDLTTNEVAPLIDGDPVSTREFSISTDGKVFAYNTVSGLSSKLQVVDERSNRRITLPSMGKASWANWASVSPDGNRVLFVEGAHSIYEYDLVENRGKASVRQISRNAEHHSDYWPRYSPSEDKILFASNRDGDFEIYVMSTRGTNATRLTHSRGIDMHPVYSPDGKRIAFTSNRDGNYEIYVMRASGGSITRVTHNPERDEFATWHPDGKRLVLVSEHDGQFDLQMVDCP